MDNDDFRRGKPTNHKVFGEGIAVLAGDALLTQAFEIAAQAKGWPRYSHRDLILEIARASGSLQLIAGQVADLEGEGQEDFRRRNCNTSTSARPPPCSAAPSGSAA